MRIVAILLLSTMGLLGAGCIGDLFGGSESAGSAENDGSPSAYSLRVGDCLDEPEDEEFVDVSITPCTSPHELEVFAVIQYPGEDEDPYPGVTLLDQVTWDICFAFFESYVYLPYADSQLDIQVFYPTGSSWTRSNDREITCVLFDTESPYMYGSMRGIRR